MSGAETARRRVVQRRVGWAESAAPKRRRRNGPPPFHSCDWFSFSQLLVFLIIHRINLVLDRRCTVAHMGLTGNP